MTRISENQFASYLIKQVNANKSKVDEYSRQISSGLKVDKPSDTRQAALIDALQNESARIEEHERRIVVAEAHLNYQDEVLQQASDLITRSREIAEQMANETNSVEARQIVASEVWALRDQMVKLGNSVYQGRYVYGGADDDDPPFDVDLTTYTSFGTPSSQQRYAFDNFDPPPTITNPPQRLVVVDDVTSIRVSSTGDAVFSRAIAALESLGRALEGYRTDTVTPDYTALTFPADYGLQTQAIRESLDDLEVARSGDIDLERSSVAGRLHQLDMTKSVLAFGKEAAKTQLATLRDADTAEAATELSLAQTALQASYTVTSRMLSLTILDYI